MEKANFTFVPKLHWLSKLTLAVLLMAFSGFQTAQAQVCQNLDLVAPDQNITIPSCADSAPAILTFSVNVDDCPNFNPANFTVTPVGQFADGRTYTVLLEGLQVGPVFDFVIVGDGNPYINVVPSAGVDFFNISYNGAPLGNVIVTAVADNDIDFTVITRDVNVTLPSCANSMEVRARVTFADCAGAPDFGDFTVTGFGQFAGRAFSIFKDTQVGPNQSTFSIGDGGDPRLTVNGPTDGGGVDRLTITYKGFNYELRINAVEDPAIDRAVVAPDINVNVPSCSDNTFIFALFDVFDCNFAGAALPTVTGFGQYAGRAFTVIPEGSAGGPNQFSFGIAEFGSPFINTVATTTADGFIINYRGIESFIRVLAIADQDIDQAIITSPGMYLTIPACEDEVTVLPDFIVLDCGFDGSALTINGIGQLAGRNFVFGQIPNSPTQVQLGIFETTNPAGVTFRAGLGGPLTGDGFEIIYKGVRVLYWVTTLEGQEKRVGPVIDEPGQNKWFIPECEVCTEVNAFFTGIDNCDGAVTPDVVSVQLLDGPTPGAPNVVRTLTQGTEWVTVTDDVGERHVRILCAAPGYYRINMSATDSDRNTTNTSFELEVEALGLPDLDNLSCNDNVYVKLDDKCVKAITADMVLEGFVCDNEFTVVVDYGMGVKTRDFINQCGTFKYEVFILRGGRMGELICWGYITAEDKTPPVVPNKVWVPVACGDLDIILANSARDAVRSTSDGCKFTMGDPKVYTSWDLILAKGGVSINRDVKDACSDFCNLKFQINDLKMEGDICARDKEGRPMVLRTVKVTDEKGNSSTFQICFYENQPQFEPGCKEGDADLHKGFKLYEDISCYMNTEIDLCKGDAAVKGSFYYYSCWFDYDDKAKVLKQRVVRPSFTATDNGGTAAFCGYAATFVDVKVPITDDCGYKITRSWKLLDWCTGEPFKEVFSKNQLIKKAYLSPLEVTIPSFGHSDPIISTGAFDCTASWVFAPPTVKACDDGAGLHFSIKIYSKVPKLDKFGIPIPGEYEWVLFNGPLRQTSGGWVASELPVGKHKVKYDVGTNCQAGTAEKEFEVKDLTAPVAICDDELNISVGGEGIARVTVQDVDEGSWDNCQLESLLLRRNLDDCLDVYLSDVLGISSLDELTEEEFTNSHGEKGKRWFRYMDTQKMILVSYEPGKDGSNHYYTWWANEVYFTCCDIATSLDDFVVLELKAVDKAGNKNICWMDVMIESKQVATCWAPADIAIACTDLNFDPADYDQVVAALGKASDLVTVDFNCAAQLTDTITWAPADCSEGVLTRTYTVTTTTSKGVVERSCTQKITVYNVNDYLIKFPADAEDTCDGDGGDDLELTTYACDVFAVHRDTAVFEASGDACFKRYVTYRVINWCEYDGISLEPTIVPRDVDCDGKLDECTWVRVEGKAKWNSDKPTNTVWIDDDNDPKKDPVITFPRTAKSYRSLACDGNKEYWITPGYWEYTQVVKVYDDEAPELTVTTDDLDFCAYGLTGAKACYGEVMILFNVEDLCTGTNVEVRSVLLAVNGVNPTNFTGELYNVDGDNGSYMISSIAGLGLPVGSHIFYVRVADDCGNITNRLIEFTVRDCKTPAPICISILSVDLMPIVENKEVVGGMNEVWATDFVASGVIDCTPHPKADAIPGSENNVRYYAVRQDELLEAGLEAPTADYLTDDYRSVFFDCDDNGDAVAVFVIGVDGAGNFDYCTVMVNVQPGVDPDPCTGEPVVDTGGRVAVAGLISTAEGNAVEGVNVNLSGQLSNTLTTGESGDYMFDGLTSGYDYTITPSHDANAMNGVSTFDLVLISKHILGVEALDSPYKLLAADVNNSRSVTTLDLIQIRKLILSIDTEFSNTTSWIFVKKDYVFPDANNPWAEQTPSIINLNNLEDDMMTGDFVAVKRGDVNASAIANSRMAAPRNVAGTFNVSTSDVAMKAGNEYTISFTAEELAQIEGYQFTLNFDNSVLELVDINYGVAKEDNFGLTHLNEGVITTSWNGAASGAEMFSMVVRAKSDAMLSELMSIGSRYTAAEAYGTTGQQLDVQLTFGDDAVANAGFELYQNTPNPFVGETQIGFSLPNASDVTITINDVTGRTLKVIRGDFAKGYNTVNVNNLPSGVMYYTLESGDFTATLKMINIK